MKRKLKRRLKRYRKLHDTVAAIDKAIEAEVNAAFWRRFTVNVDDVTGDFVLTVAGRDVYHGK